MICIFQFLVAAKDRGTPQRVSDHATVNIEVIRNDNAPQFSQATISASIPQNQETGKRIASVTSFSAT